MSEIVHWLLSHENFMPHGHCYLWQPVTLWLNVGSDALIAGSYLAIPVAIYSFTRRRSIGRFAWIPMMFAAFILLCGATHIMEIWTVWNPVYRVAGVLKLLTGIVSLATLLSLIRIMPHALALKTPGQLQAEVDARRASEVRLQKITDAIPATITYWDVGGICRFANRTHAKRSRWTPEDDWEDDWRDLRRGFRERQSRKRRSGPARRASGLRLFAVVGGR